MIIVIRLLYRRFSAFPVFCKKYLDYLDYLALICFCLLYRNIALKARKEKMTLKTKCCFQVMVDITPPQVHGRLPE